MTDRIHARFSQVGKQILEYLLENAQARDTAEGIWRWWLKDSNPCREEVLGALNELVEQGFVECVDGPFGAPPSFRLVSNQHERIRTLLKDGEP